MGLNVVALSFCSDKGFKQCSMKLVNVDTRNHENYTLNAVFYHIKENSQNLDDGKFQCLCHR